MPFLGLIAEGDPIPTMKQKLTPEVMRAHALAIMSENKWYPSTELYGLVKETHDKMGGAPSQNTNPQHTFTTALKVLREKQQLESRSNPDGTLEFKRVSGADPIPSLADVERGLEQGAELSIGDGPEHLYGWYLPAYRELATLKGSPRSPITIGRTVRNPEERINDSAGLAPEHPKLGILVKVANAQEWEPYLQATLTLEGHRLTGAKGTEWFDTTLEDVQELVETEMARIGEKNHENAEDSTNA